MNGVNIVFYSRNCETCKILLQILQNENLLSYFKLYCVDGNIQSFSSIIKKVPTMIVAGINKSLEDQEIFEWIQKIKFIRQQNVNKQVTSNDGGMGNINNNNNNNNNNNKPKGPVGYAHLEMGGISDPFAYKDVDMPLIHNYHNVKEEGKHAIFTAPEQEKISPDEQAKRIQDLEKFRDIQESEYSKQMKEQQTKAVLAATQENRTKQII